ncbi:diaminopimelate epimerase [Streptomyces sp. NPDC001389]|uniref:diaminopimelate epimerase n=1 Tax=Streptomyces sp. NPDC001389 TaxID=3364569 RepID=UPI0036935A01
MNTTPTGTPFAKGHGTGNDFLVLDDPDNRLNLTPATTRRLCDRRTGMGADGLLRLVRTDASPEAASMAGHAQWFMDYRNADGSLGAMCGNGIRVLARYLTTTGRHGHGPLTIATRAGLRELHVAATGDPHHGEVSVSMGRPLLPGPDGIKVAVGDRCWPALHVDVGNPHAVAFIDDLRHAGTLDRAPVVTPSTAYPHGTTVEFVRDLGSRHLVLRVHERGVGETPSCGTGACAAAIAALHRSIATPSHPVRYTVDAIGGRLLVDITPDADLTLTGPAHITAQGTLRLPAPWPPEARPADSSQLPYGAPSPELISRADRGLHRFLTNNAPRDMEAAR